MIYHGDLFDVLPTLEANSIDACVTDPPYGLGFMGKSWDTFKPGEGEKRVKPRAEIASDNPNLKNRKNSPASSPSAVEYDRSLKGQHEFQAWTERWAREVLRVLKPGAHLLVCGAPRSGHRMIAGIEDAGFEVRDCLAWIFGQGFPKSLNVGEGRGTALKPAYEPIVLARKPLIGTVAENVLEHGTGALNIDACRIAGQKPDTTRGAGGQNGMYSNIGAQGRIVDDGLGRWPANVCLDEDAAELIDVSRFFYVAKPSRGEREHGIYDLEPRQRDESRKDGNPGGDNPRNRGLQRRGNHHPTVKPIELMRWLVKLVTPPGGKVLDPFCGSGTTGMACAFEFLEFLGIEREAEYVEIAKRRIASCAPLFTETTDA